MFGAVIFVEKLRTMFRLLHPGTAGGHSELHPVIDETVSAWPFTEVAIDLSPAAPGVYLLYRDGRLIYIGVAMNGATLRGELASHLRGARGDCTHAATAFTFELTPDPRGRHRRYLSMHRDRYGGRLPAGNEGEPGADAMLGS